MQLHELKPQPSGCQQKGQPQHAHIHKHENRDEHALDGSHAQEKALCSFLGVLLDDVICVKINLKIVVIIVASTEFIKHSAYPQNSSTSLA